MVQLQLRQLDISPGQRIVFQKVDWQQFEAIIEELGHRATRLSYFKVTLEIVAPLELSFSV